MIYYLVVNIELRVFKFFLNYFSSFYTKMNFLTQRLNSVLS